MDISSQDLTVDFNFAECEKAANEQKSGTVKKEVSDISKYLLVQEGSLALKEQKETLKKELAVYKMDDYTCSCIRINVIYSHRQI